jgi:hypothetical protein
MEQVMSEPRQLNNHGNKRSKISIYLSEDQENKLDDLVHEYKKVKGRRINRNDIVRYLVDRCTIDSLMEL